MEVRYTYHDSLVLLVVVFKSHRILEIEPILETIILAAISECKITAHNDLDMHYYRDEGALQVVDISTVQCLVGRIKTTNGRDWAIIDRSGSLARPYYDPDT
jgi:hypothetical protein